MNTGRKLLIMLALLIAYLVLGGSFLPNEIHDIVSDILFIGVLPFGACICLAYMKGAIKAKKQMLKRKNLNADYKLLKRSCFYEMQKSGLGETEDAQRFVRSFAFFPSIMFPMARLFKLLECDFKALNMGMSIAVTAMLAVLLTLYADYITSEYYAYKGVEIVTEDV